MKLLSLLLLSITTAILAQDVEEAKTWDGCYDVNRNLIKKGSPMFLCLHMANGINWSEGVDFIRLSFSPDVDEYSRLHVPNCTFAVLCSAVVAAVVVVWKRHS